MSEGDFLSRWSRRKHQARKGEVPAEPAVAAVPAANPLPATPEPVPAEATAPLPAIESLTLESDFTGFMKPDVDLGLRNQALKALFSDPRFNVMDGLDVYIDDYSKPDPLPEGWLEKMQQVARLGAYEPPKEQDAAEAADEPVQDAAEAGAQIPAPSEGEEREDSETG